MDDLTVSIAQYIGPVLIAVGLGIFFSKNYYTKVYRNLEQETLAVFMSGITILVAGLAIVINHNIWDNLLSSLVSLIGWLSIIKGFILIVRPKLADKFGDQVANTQIFPYAASVAIIIGLYMTYMTYMFYVLS